MSQKVITGMVRFSYAYPFEPVSMNEGDPEDKKRYQATLLIPKSDTATMSRIKAAISAAEEVGSATIWGGKVPKVYKNQVIKDGDEPHPETGEVSSVNQGNWVIRSRSKNKPGLVDADLNPILDRDEFYSGCYGRASVTFIPYFQEGTKGISCCLNNLQKLKDGERLAGGASAEEDFGGDNAIEADDLM